MRPFTFIKPTVGDVTRDNIFKSVDLPAPFLPMIPTTSPCSTLKLISFSAHTKRLSPFFVRSFTSPIFRYGSSLPRTRAHQRLRSWLSVPVPNVPSTYCLPTLSNSITFLLIAFVILSDVDFQKITHILIQ